MKNLTKILENGHPFSYYVPCKINFSDKNKLDVTFVQRVDGMLINNKNKLVLFFNSNKLHPTTNPKWKFLKSINFEGRVNEISF